MTFLFVLATTVVLEASTGVHYEKARAFGFGIGFQIEDLGCLTPMTAYPAGFHGIYIVYVVFTKKIISD